MPLWLADRPLVLASKSEIRHAILRDAGVPVEIVPADIDERAIEQHADTRDAGQIAALLAREKARAIAAGRSGRLVLGADQTLAVGERRFSKPIDRAAAREQLKVLRGRTHELHTAVALSRDGTMLFERREAARLTMRAFSDDFLEAYLDAVGQAATASVGGYQLEKAGIQLFERIEGDHFVILGLPLLSLLQYFRQEGWLAT
jgi:nucleoside triphosphate pyrophosphatase